MTCWGAAAAELRFDGRRIVKVVDFRMGMARAALNDSPASARFTTAKMGMLTTTASGTLLYRSGDEHVAAILLSVLAWGRNRGLPITLRLDRIGSRFDLPSVLVRQVDTDVAVGQLTKVPVAFQVNCEPIPVFR